MNNRPKVLAETKVADGLALMLETACRDFEILLALIRNEWGLTSTEPFLAERARGAIRMALAKSFVFHAIRAGRICERGAQYIDVSAADRKVFLAALRPMSKVRNVNEHGFDPTVGSRGKRSAPSIHTHELESATLDETSLIILGDQKILMGSLNLCDFYGPLNLMRALAGFGRDRSVAKQK